jgi:hypothetical protein
LIAEVHDMHTPGILLAFYLYSIGAYRSLIESKRRHPQVPTIEVDRARTRRNMLYLETADAHSAELVIGLCQHSDHIGWLRRLIGREIWNEAPTPHCLLDGLGAVTVVQGGSHQCQASIEEAARILRFSIQRLEATLGEHDDVSDTLLGSGGAAERNMLYSLARLFRERVEVRTSGVLGRT